MNKNEYVMIPNSFLLYEDTVIEIYYWLIYNENKFGKTNFSVNWLMAQCNIAKDKNNRNKKYIRDLFKLDNYDALKTIDIASLYEINDSKKKCNYTKIYIDEHDIIKKPSLFKQFLYIARNIDNETMYMGHSVKQMSEALGYSNNTITSNNEQLKELGVIDYVNTNYYSSKNGHHLNYTNFYTLSMRVDDSNLVLNKAIEYYDSSMGNIGLQKTNEKYNKSMLKKYNGVISYYSRLNIKDMTNAEKEKYEEALQFKLKYHTTDWADKPESMFIQSLVDNRYKKFGFTYDVCEKIFKGDLRIVDAIEENIAKD